MTCAAVTSARSIQQNLGDVRYEVQQRAGIVGNELDCEQPPEKPCQVCSPAAQVEVRHQSQLLDSPDLQPLGCCKQKAAVQLAHLVELAVSEGGSR